MVVFVVLVVLVVLVVQQGIIMEPLGVWDWDSVPQLVHVHGVSCLFNFRLFLEA
jgi:hypothetical protein